MNKETVLKKQFQKRDVERLRNLMKGKYGEKTRSSVGFSKSQDFYKEGDIWEVDGRTWTIKDGMKRVDKPYYNIHKYCLDCHAKAEDKLRIKGEYKEHYDSINNKVISKRINEFKDYVKEKLEESNDSFVSESGEVEKWVGKIDKDKVDLFTKEVIQHLESFKK